MGSQANTPKDLLEIREMSVKIEQEEKERREKLLKDLLSYNLPDALKDNIKALGFKEKKELKKIKIEVIDRYDEESGDYVKTEKPLTLHLVDSNEDAKDEFIDFICNKRDINPDDFSVPELDIFVKLIVFATLYPLEFEGN